MHTITCAIVYWTDRVSFSFVYMCVNQHTCAKLLICVVYLEISPAESPPTDNCIFFLRTVKKKLITAILENSSFLAKTLCITIAYLASSLEPHAPPIVWRFAEINHYVGLRSDTNMPCRDHLWPLSWLLIINIHFTQCYARYYPYFTCR